jgi:predicted acetyltransferase
VIELRVADDEQWRQLVRSDGRSFGTAYSDEDIERQRAVTDLSRFRVAVEDGRVVGGAGSYELAMTLPGGAAVPTGGVTWVSVEVTHRRQGLLRRLMDAIHDDIDAREEPLAALTASEGGIYERFGYGIASRTRIALIDRAHAHLRPDVVPPTGTTRVVDPLAELDAIMAIWDRFRTQRAGEVTRSEVWWRNLIADSGEYAVHVLHADGYASWKSDMAWNDGHPAGTLVIHAMAPVTPEAHVALWHTALSSDLVGTVRSTKLALDDPLPFLLTNQRVVRTTNLNDGVWCHVRDVAGCFGARRYGTDDDIVVEVDGTRWRIGAGGTTKVRSKPDLTLDRAALGSLLLGGVAPTTLVGGRRAEARSAEALRRADALFVVNPMPSCQTGF